MSEAISPFEIEGSAALLQLNARKEGPDDHKVLATDLKLRIVMSNDILLSFDPQLRVMMFNKEGEPRFPRMGTVSWDQEFNDMALEIDAPLASQALKFAAVKIRKFTFEPRKAGQVDLVFQATVKPSHGEFDLLGQVLLADSAKIKIFARQGDMFAEPKAAEQPKQPAVEQAGAPRGQPVDDQPADVAAPAAPLTEVLENSVNAINPAGIALGFKLDKRQHAVGSTFEDGGIVYDITGQGATTITLSARAPGAVVPPAPPALTEISDEMKAKVRAAGQAEAAKHEDDRDFEAGFQRCCQELGLSRADVDEFYGELQNLYTEGWEATPETAV